MIFRFLSQTDYESKRTKFDAKITITVFFQIRIFDAKITMTMIFQIRREDRDYNDSSNLKDKLKDLDVEKYWSSQKTSMLKRKRM